MSKWRVIDPKGSPLHLVFYDKSNAMKYAYRETKLYREEGNTTGDFKVEEIK